jgi:hypothetical protein
MSVYRNMFIKLNHQLTEAIDKIVMFKFHLLGATEVPELVEY